MEVLPNELLMYIFWLTDNQDKLMFRAISRKYRNLFECDCKKLFSGYHYLKLIQEHEYSFQRCKRIKVSNGNYYHVAMKYLRQINKNKIRWIEISKRSIVSDYDEAKKLIIENSIKKLPINLTNRISIIMKEKSIVFVSEGYSETNKLIN